MAVTINIPTQVSQSITNGVTTFAPSENAVFGGLSNRFANGGNSFGAAGVIGTNDNFQLALRTNGINRWLIGTDGRTTNGSFEAGMQLRVEGNFRCTNFGYFSTVVTDRVFSSGNSTGFNITNGGVTSNRFNNHNNTTGTNGFLFLSLGFNPTSGTGNYNVQTINPTINQTGNASGISRGLIINPTLTSAADWRALEIQTDSLSTVFLGRNIGSAAMQIDSTVQGFLPPRMTTTQKNAIATPTAGLIVYDDTLNQLSYYNGTTWVNI
jgi:hypothetical protein